MQSLRNEKIELLILLDEKERRACERSYYEFFKRAWPVLEQETPLKDNWHIQYLCDVLQGEMERIAARLPRDQDLDINISPRSGKSQIVSIMLCPWVWTKWPRIKFINSSHAKELSTDHSVKSRDLILSDWYQKHWGHVYRLTSDQNEKTFFKNNRGGHRKSTSVEAKIIGFGGDVIIGDDLMDSERANSEAERLRANHHWENALFSRLNDPDVGLRINVQQRLHEDDISGHVHSKNPGDYRRICIPAEYDEKTVSPKELKKFYKDGLFFPNRFNKKILERARRTLGSKQFAGQFGQQPSTPGGTIIKREWWRTYRRRPEKFDKILQSWDMTFKEKSARNKGKIDYVAGTVWGLLAQDLFLLDFWKEKVGFNESKKAVVRMTLKWPKTSKILIEDKANGPAIEDSLKKDIPNILLVPPKGDKIERAEATTPIFEGGHVYAPDPEMYSWVEPFIEAHTIFPDGVYDDEVDTTTQVINHVFNKDNSKDRLKALLTM